MAEALSRMILEERRFPGLVRFVNTLRGWRVLTLTLVVAGIAVVFALDVVAEGWFIISGFYLVPLTASSLILRFGPTLYLVGLSLVLSGTVMLAQGAVGPEPALFFLFELLACIGLLVLAHLFTQVDRISRRAGLRARYAEAIADIAGKSGGGESAEEIVAFALDRIRTEIDARAAIVLRLRDGVWTAVAAHGVDANPGELRLPFPVLPDAARALDQDTVVLGGACLDREALSVVEEDEAREHAGALASLRSCLSVPLRAHGEELGVIVLGHTDADATFAPDQVRFAESVAGYTATALDSARLMHELAARERDLSMVVDSSLDFAATLDLGEVLRAVIERLTAALSVAECDVYQVDEERRKLITLAGIDLVRPEMASKPGREYDFDRWTSTMTALSSGEAVVVYGSDDERLSAEERRYFDLRGFTCLLVQPLKAADRVIGLVEMFDRTPGRRFTDSELALAEAVCRFAGLAIENAHLFEEQRLTAERNDRLIGQLQRLMGIALRLNHLQTQPDVQRLLDTVVRSGAALLDAQRVAIVDAQQTGLVVDAIYDAAGPEEEPDEGQARPVPLWLGAFAPPRSGTHRGAGTPSASVQQGRLIVPVSSSQVGEEAYLVFADKRRGAFSAEDELLASTLAIQLAASLTNTQTYRREFEIAETLQNALQLEPPKVRGLDVGLRYKAATEAARVGGDFYDLVSLGAGRLMICVGDVCGKGLTAAAQTALVRYMLRAYVAEGSPGESLSRLNSTLMTQEENLPFVTLIVAYIDVPRRMLEFSAAGHPRPVVISGGKKVETPPDGGYPLGLFRGAVYPTNHLVLPPDATIVLHTDGLLEARRNGKLFGERRLGQAVRANAEQGAQDVAEGIMAAVQRYTGGVLDDDAAVVVIRLP